jgi:hypothetical protein
LIQTFKKNEIKKCVPQDSRMDRVPLKNYEDLYTITKDGEVFSKKRKKPLSVHKKSNCLAVSLFRGEDRKEVPIHELLANMFLPNPDNCKKVVFKDGNSSNYKLENLMWQKDRRRDLADEKGCIAVTQYKLDGTFVKTYSRLSDARDATGCRKDAISDVCQGKGNSAGGYVWKYVKEFEQHPKAVTKQTNKELTKDWVIVQKYPIYKVSRDGRVYNTKTSRILKNSVHTEYMKTGLMIGKQGKIIRFPIHKLVAMAYLPNPDNYPIINHKDGNKLNNNVENLEWCTQSQNMAHAVDTGLLVVKGKNFDPNTKYSKDELKERTKTWKTIAGYENYKVSPQGDVCNVKLWYLLKPNQLNMYSSVHIKKKSMFIHKLVAQAYIPNPNNHTIVRHKDMNNLNNDIENLEWISKKDNSKHISTAGLLNSIKVAQYNLDGTLVKIWNSMSDAEDHFGSRKGSGNISGACRKQMVTSYGFYWKYADDPFTEKDRERIDTKLKPKVVHVKWANGTEDIFNSLQEASDKTFVPISTIRSRCGKDPPKTGDVWRYI